jgi:hypothetical protein
VDDKQISLHAFRQNFFDALQACLVRERDITGYKEPDLNRIPDLVVAQRQTND